MTYDGAAIVYALYLRVCRLNPDGTPKVGTGNLFTTDGLVSIAFGLEYTEGEEIEKKNGAGKVCVYYKAPDTLKRLTVASLEICSPNPELYEMLAGGSVLTSGTGETMRSVGYQAPEVGTNPNPDGVSIEAWSAAVIDGSPAAVDPYVWWVLPRTYLRPDGNVELGADAVGATFSGWGNQNASWGAGPLGDWEFDSERVYQWVRTDTVPTPSTSAEAVPAPTP